MNSIGTLTLAILFICGFAVVLAISCAIAAPWWIGGLLGGVLSVVMFWRPCERRFIKIIFQRCPNSGCTALLRIPVGRREPVECPKCQTLVRVSSDHSFLRIVDQQGDVVVTYRRSGILMWAQWVAMSENIPDE